MTGNAPETGGATPAWAARRRAIAESRYWTSPIGRRGRWRHRLLSHLLTVFGWGLRVTPFHGIGRRNALALELVELELAFDRLPPAFDGFRILHLSDTHLDALPAAADVGRRLLDGLEVDLLAVTGDIHGHPRNPLQHSVGLLAEVLGGVTVRHRKLATLGNHDPVEMAEALEKLGIETLVNCTTTLTCDGQILHVTGLDDVHSFYTSEARAAVERKADGFRIALVHSAEVADHAAAAGCSLYLCGHTHAGQIALPGGRPVFTQLVRCRHAATGLWRQGDMVGYTSPGLGVSPPAVRFNTRGGAALITLRAAPR